LLIFELAVIQDAADRRACAWRDLNQVELRLFGATERVGDRYDADLAAVSSDEPNLRNANPLIDTVSFLRGWNEPWTSSSKRQMTSFRTAPMGTRITLHRRPQGHKNSLFVPHRWMKSRHCASSWCVSTTAYPSASAARGISRAPFGSSRINSRTLPGARDSSRTLAFAQLSGHFTPRRS